MENALNSLNNINLRNINSAEQLGQRVGYTNEEFFKFAKQADLSGDVLQQYKDYMQSSTTATSKFGATLLSIGANMAIAFAVTTAISLAAKGIDLLVHKVENAKKKMDESNTSLFEINNSNIVIMHLKSLGNFTNAINEGKQLGSMLAISANASKVLESSLKDLSAVQILARTSSLKLSEAQKIELIQLYATDKANYENITSTATHSAAQKKATATTGGLTAATKGLWATMKAHPIMTVTAAIGLAYGAYSKWKQIQEENRQIAEDAAKTYTDTSKSINEYTKKYEELRTALLDAKGNEEETKTPYKVH